MERSARPRDPWRPVKVFFAFIHAIASLVTLYAIGIASVITAGVAWLFTTFEQVPLGVQYLFIFGSFLIQIASFQLLLPRIFPSLAAREPWIRQPVVDVPKRGGVTVAQLEQAFTRRDAIEAAKQELQPVVELRRSLQLINGEIGYGLHLLQSAKTSGFYWRPDRRTIKADEWAKYHESLAGESGLDGPYQAAESAYYEFDRMNHLAQARFELWQNNPERSRSVQSAMGVSPFDNLDNAIAVAQEARIELNNAINEIKEP